MTVLKMDKILFGMDILEWVVDVVVQNLDQVDILVTHQDHMVILAVVEVVVLNSVEMDLQLAEIIDKPQRMVLNNHKVPKEQIMEKMVVMEEEETTLVVVEEVLEQLEVLHQLILDLVIPKVVMV